MSDQRTNTTQRGYGYTHQRARKRWAPYVATGQVPCTRCGKSIAPDQAWHLDHNDDRQGYRGPAHKTCNIGASNDRRDLKPRPTTNW